MRADVGWSRVKCGRFWNQMQGRFVTLNYSAIIRIRGKVTRFCLVKMTLKVSDCWTNLLFELVKTLECGINTMNRRVPSHFFCAFPKLCQLLSLCWVNFYVIFLH